MRGSTTDGAVRGSPVAGSIVEAGGGTVAPGDVTPGCGVVLGPGSEGVVEVPGHTDGSGRSGGAPVCGTGSVVPGGMPDVVPDSVSVVVPGDVPRVVPGTGVGAGNGAVPGSGVVPGGEPAPGMVPGAEPVPPRPLMPPPVV
ncbi:MAG TPA: hypothetical protein VNO23_05245 [Candidatus Binatia bacterium]|nr:hypothetical protein [Candidatus Binatia bacterium]